MHYKHFHPIPALQPYIECFWIIEAPANNSKRARMPADNRATLLLNFSGDSSMTTAEGTIHHVGVGAYLLGVHDQSYMLEHTGDTYLIAAQFRPGGLAPFVQYGVGELANQTISLDLLWGNAGNWLCEQIYEADTISEKLIHYQNALLKHFSEVPYQLHIFHTLKQIETQTNVSVKQLAEEINLSQKHFERLFKRVVGMMPKRSIRLARFQKLVSWLRQARSPESWAVIAAQFDYYDHSHLAKDFRAFADTTPSEFVNVTAGVIEIAYGQQSELEEV